MYYLRSRPAADPIKFTVDVESLLKTAGHIEIEHKEKKPEETLKMTTLENMNIESYDIPTKRTKPNENEEPAPKVCPLRRKDAPIDEECMACGS